jgi:hypothetical protein
MHADRFFINEGLQKVSGPYMRQYLQTATGRDARWRGSSTFAGLFCCFAAWVIVRHFRALATSGTHIRMASCSPFAQAPAKPIATGTATANFCVENRPRKAESRFELPLIGRSQTSAHP